MDCLWSAVPTPKKEVPAAMSDRHVSAFRIVRYQRICDSTQ